MAGEQLELGNAAVYIRAKLDLLNEDLEKGRAAVVSAMQKTGAEASKELEGVGDGLKKILEAQGLEGSRRGLAILKEFGPSLREMQKAGVDVNAVFDRLQKTSSLPPPPSKDIWAGFSAQLAAVEPNSRRAVAAFAQAGQATELLGASANRAAMQGFRPLIAQFGRAAGVSPDLINGVANVSLGMGVLTGATVAAAGAALMWMGKELEAIKAVESAEAELERKRTARLAERIKNAMRLDALRQGKPEPTVELAKVDIGTAQANLQQVTDDIENGAKTVGEALRRFFYPIVVAREDELKLAAATEDLETAEDALAQAIAKVKAEREAANLAEKKALERKKLTDAAEAEKKALDELSRSWEEQKDRLAQLNAEVAEAQGGRPADIEMKLRDYQKLTRLIEENQHKEDNASKLKVEQWDSERQTLLEEIKLLEQLANIRDEQGAGDQFKGLMDDFAAAAEAAKDALADAGLGSFGREIAVAQREFTRFQKWVEEQAQFTEDQKTALIEAAAKKRADIEKGAARGAADEEFQLRYENARLAIELLGKVADSHDAADQAMAASAREVIREQQAGMEAIIQKQREAQAAAAQTAGATGQAAGDAAAALADAGAGAAKSVGAQVAAVSAAASDAEREGESVASRMEAAFLSSFRNIEQGAQGVKRSFDELANGIIQKLREIAEVKASSAGGSTSTSGKARGGSFRVGGGGGLTDNALVAFYATKGEEVRVLTQEQQRAERRGGGTTVAGGVVVHNYGLPGMVEVEAGGGPDGRLTSVFVGRAVARGLASGGMLDRGARRRYGLEPTAVERGG